MNSGILRKRILLIVIPLLSLLVSLNEFQLFFNFKASSYSKFQKEFNRVIPQLMDRHKVPGAAVALIQKGRISLCKGYGWANKDKDIRVDRNTVFQVASNSKTVASWGVMKLVEEKKIGLDIPVEKYLTRWHLPKSKYNKNVTIRRLLSHTAGLCKISYAGYPPEDKLPTLVDSLNGKAKGVKRLRVITRPGKKYRYSGGEYTLLQLIIEEVTGKSFAEYMKSKILNPLGMKSSSYQLNADIEGRQATAYGALGQAMPDYVYTEKAAAGLYTTALDFAKFAIASMDDNKSYSVNQKVLKSMTLRLMHKVVKEDYGLGYIIKRLPDDTRLIYHGGTNRGWRAQFAILPDKRNGLVVLTNSENGENLHRDLMSIWTKWNTGYYPGFFAKDRISRIIIKTLASIVFIFAIIILWNLVKDIISRKRVFFLSRKKTAENNFAKVTIRSLPPLILIAAWMFAFYTGYIYAGWTFASFTPSGFIYLTASILVTCMFLFVRGLFGRCSSTVHSGKSIGTSSK